MMSGFMAWKMIEDLALEVYNDPSAFQFRVGECKGVLVGQKSEVYIDLRIPEKV